jgi:hypothetical protein
MKEDAAIRTECDLFAEARARIVGNVEVVSDTGCWNWVGNPRENGYCRTSYKRRYWYIHRLSFAAFGGNIPKGFDVCHTCDNRKCCNPDHLFTGTRRDNMEDAVGKGRQARGEKLSTLKDEDVIEIRMMFLNGESAQLIADKFNRSTSCVWQIVSRKSWRHI